METPLESLAESAKDGDRAALETLVRRIKDRIYGLALRMLWLPQDAEDATQEILLKVITHLSDFRGESAFFTWVYRVAANYLITTRKRTMERHKMTFEWFGQDLDEGLSEALPAEAAGADARLLEEEVKIGCTHAMLLCLDRGHRLAYILGEVFALTSAEASGVMDLTPEAFRQRLSRARTAIRGFMERKCGIVNPSNPCRCRRRIVPAMAAGRVDPKNLLFTGRPTAPPRATVQRVISEMEAFRRCAALFQSHPDFQAPEPLVEGVMRFLQAGNYRVLDE